MSLINERLELLLIIFVLAIAAIAVGTTWAAIDDNVFEAIRVIRPAPSSTTKVTPTPIPAREATESTAAAQASNHYGSSLNSLAAD